MTTVTIRPNNGIFGSEDAALQGIVERLKVALDPREIWLFGSRARGDARPDSDFDLMVVAKPGGKFGSDDYDRVDAPLRGTGVGTDVVPCSAEDFEDGAALSTSFVARVLGEGRRLYAAETQ
jgi:predicted nucleotidyltransferase